MKISHNIFYLNLARNSPVVVWWVLASLKGLCLKKKKKRERESERENDKLQTIMWQETQEEVL